MKKRNIIITLLLLLLLLISVGFHCFLIYKTNYNNHSIFKSNNNYNAKENNYNLAFMLETGIGTGVFEQSSSSSWPKDSSGYTFDSSKSACENGSSLSFVNSTGTLSISTNKTDKCYIYFNKVYLWNKYNSIVTYRFCTGAYTLYTYGGNSYSCYDPSVSNTSSGTCGCTYVHTSGTNGYASKCTQFGQQPQSHESAYIEITNNCTCTSEGTSGGSCTITGYTTVSSTALHETQGPGDFISTVTSTTKTYPDNGEYTDGYWYVLQ
jgi:hypothetical protein